MLCPWLKSLIEVILCECSHHPNHFMALLEWMDKRKENLATWKVLFIPYISSFYIYISFETTFSEREEYWYLRKRGKMFTPLVIELCLSFTLDFVVLLRAVWNIWGLCSSCWQLSVWRAKVNHFLGLPELRFSPGLFSLVEEERENLGLRSRRGKEPQEPRAPARGGIPLL